MSDERQRHVQVDVSLDENAARVTITEEREVADEGRSCISPREVADRVDLAPSRVGQAMSLLSDDEELTLVSRTHPKTWRIER